MKKLAQDKRYILLFILNILFLIVAVLLSIDRYGKSHLWIYLPTVVFYTLMIRTDIMYAINFFKPETTTNQSN